MAIAHSTRWQRRPTTHNSVEDALEETAKFYRKSLWSEADAYVEVWLEKDALAGVVWPVTDMYDVPLMVARGYASLSFLHGAAEYIGSIDVPTYIYHLAITTPPASMQARRSNRPSRIWLLMPTSAFNGSA